MTGTPEVSNFEDSSSFTSSSGSSLSAALSKISTFGRPVLHRAAYHQNGVIQTCIRSICLAMTVGTFLTI